MWVREIFQGRKNQGVYNNLVQEMRLGDRESYFRYMRMSPDRFEHLLSLIEPLVKKETTNFREPISAGERLSITLRFLATGESQQSLSFAYRIGKATVCKIIVIIIGYLNGANIFLLCAPKSYICQALVFIYIVTNSL